MFYLLSRKLLMTYKRVLNLRDWQMLSFFVLLMRDVIVIMDDNTSNFI